VNKSIIGLLIAIVAAAHGCSLISLSSELHQDPCTSDRDCDVLNDHDAFVECRHFSCNANRRCEAGPPDVDRDGYVSQDCATDPARADCDDSDPLRYPGNTEVCDGRDNDCDKRIDEGVLVATANAALALGSGAVDDISRAVDPSSGHLALLYERGVPAQRELLDLYVGAAMGATPVVLQIDGAPLTAASTKLALLAAGGLAVSAYRDAEAVPRSAIFNLNQGARDLQLDDDELHCEPSEACAAKATDPSSARPTPFSNAPVLSPGPNLAWLAITLRRPDAGDVCNPAGPHPVLANQLTPTATGLTESSSHATQVGSSLQRDAPTLLGLRRSSMSGGAYGWLVGYTDLDGGYGFRRLAANGGELQVSSRLLVLDSDGQPLSQVRVALGIGNAQSQAIGLVGVRGCGDSARVAATRLTAELAPNGQLTLSQTAALRELGGEDGQTEPDIAWQQAQQSWGVAYRDQSGVRARVLDLTGAPLGEQPYLLATSAAVSGRDQQVGAIVALTDRPYWFAVFALEHDRADDATTLTSTRLASCGTLP
jgi:hypothetical protein